MKKFRRPFTLLEVLIALALVSLCLLPLLAPYYMMLQESKRQTAAIIAMRESEESLVNIVEKMYRQQIAWNTLFTKESYPITPHIEYSFGNPLKKTKQNVPVYFLFPLTISITTGEEKPLQFTYQLFVEKKFEPSKTEGTK